MRRRRIPFDLLAEIGNRHVDRARLEISRRAPDPLEKLRARGKVVLLGGPHFRGRSTHAEAARHADVIAGSMCEQQMRTILDAVTAGRLAANRRQPLYVADTENRFRYPENFYQSLKSRKWYQVPTIPTSVGCPYDCSFCAAYMQGKYLLRDIGTVYNEMAHSPGRIALICDATFGLRKRYTIDLMRALAPLKKKIGIETTLARLKDRQVLEAMGKGGVTWLVVGVETVAEKFRKHGSADLPVSASFLTLSASAASSGVDRTATW